MRLNAGSRLFYDLYVTSQDVDLTDATLELGVAGTWVATTWTAPATSRQIPVAGQDPVTEWTRHARTSQPLAGPEASSTGATVLPLGRNLTETRVIVDDLVSVADHEPIIVS